MAALHNAVQVVPRGGAVDGGYRQVEVWSAGELVATDNRGSPKEASKRFRLGSRQWEDSHWTCPARRGDRTRLEPRWASGGRLPGGAESTRRSSSSGIRLTAKRASPVSDRVASGRAHFTNGLVQPDGAYLAVTVSNSDRPLVVWDTSTRRDCSRKPLDDVDSPHQLDVAFLDNRTLLVAHGRCRRSRLLRRPE